MPVHVTYFNPVAVVRLDEETGQRTIEVDFNGSLNYETGDAQIDVATAEASGEFLDTVLSGGGLFEEVKEGLVVFRPHPPGMGAETVKSVIATEALISGFEVARP